MSNHQNSPEASVAACAEQCESARSRLDLAERAEGDASAKLAQVAAALNTEIDSPDQRRALRATHADASRAQEEAASYTRDCGIALERAKVKLQETQKAKRQAELRPVADIAIYRKEVEADDIELTAAEARVQTLKTSIDRRWQTLVNARSELGLPPADRLHFRPISLRARAEQDPAFLRSLLDGYVPSTSRGEAASMLEDLEFLLASATGVEASQAIRDGRYKRAIKRNCPPGTVEYEELNRRRIFGESAPDGSPLPHPNNQNTSPSSLPNRVLETARAAMARGMEALR